LKLIQIGNFVGVIRPKERLGKLGAGQGDTVYAIAITRKHPFDNGNKRTAYVALKTFNYLNGCGFPVGDADAVVNTLDMASGEASDEAFIDWVRSIMTVPP
jgi:prophage maintenance system killer protein